MKTNFFDELLESFDLLKKRKFRIVEGKNSPEAEQKAKHYIQLAISNSGRDTYIVAIPELGSNAKIYIPKSGNKIGKVVVDNVLSMYPMPVADSAGNPLRPAYFQFVGKFNEILMKDQLGSQPNPMQAPPMGQDPMGMGMVPMGPPPAVEGLYKATGKLVGMAQSKRLFSLPRSIASPNWMTPGPMEEYQELQNLVVGPLPFSLENKIMNATKIMKDPTFGAEMTMPISDEDKKLVADIFSEFIEKYNKLHMGTFNQNDSLWVKQRIINDKTGFWIRDPLLMPNGISLSWRFSNSDPQHSFFRYLILTYNKLYRQWAMDKKLQPTNTLLDINKSHFQDLDAYELGTIRGKTAEELSVISLMLYNGMKDEAKMRLGELARDYQGKIEQAYAMVAPYQEGLSAADATVINTLNMLKDLDSVSDKTIQPLLSIVNKIVWVEQYGILKRKPFAANLLDSTVLGEVSDLQELYNPGELFNVLTQKHKFSPEEATDLAKSAVLNIGLKTYLKKRNDINLSDRSLHSLLTSIIDYKHEPFVQKTCIDFGLNPIDVVAKTDKLQNISKLLNTLISEINVPGYPQKSIEKSTLKLVMDKIWANSEFNDLATVMDLDKLDLKNKDSKKRVRALLESRLILAYLTKHSNDPSWRSYISLLFYLNCGSLNNQLLCIRSLDRLDSLTINHNYMLKDILAKFNSGLLSISNSNSNLAIIDPYTNNQLLKLSFSEFKKPNFQNYLSTTVNYNTAKAYSRT